MLLGGAFRGAARCVTRRRAPRRAFVSGRAVLKSKRVCVRAGRAAGLALWAGRKTSTAQLYTVVTLLACERRRLLLLELLWLVAVTLHAGARAAGPTRLRVTATACMHTTGFRI